MRITSGLGLLMIALWLPAAWTTNVYVVVPGTLVPQLPYTNWSMAATNIQDAVDAINTNNGNYVYVSNGVYYLTNQIVITNVITLQSWNNGVIDRTNTVIHGNNYASKPVTNRCVWISNANATATVSGFTLTGGVLSNDNGAGCFMTNGVLRNCIISSNVTWGTSGGGGGGISCNNGMVLDCVITRNTAYNLGGGLYLVRGATTVSNCEISLNSQPAAAQNGGGGVYASSPGNYTFDRCVISGNVSAATSTGGGGAVFRSTYLLRNCLIVSNAAYMRGGGVYNWTSGGRLENCTIVGNRTTGTDTGGGFYNLPGGGYSAKIDNSIVYFNTAAGAGTTSNYVTEGGVTWTNCCSAPDLNALSVSNVNNITADPQLVNRAADNYRLSNISPCINAGVNRAWMTGAVDLDGRRRIVNNIADIGAYEFLPSGTVVMWR